MLSCLWILLSLCKTPLFIGSRMLQAQSGDGGYVVTIQPKDAQRRVSIEDGTLPDDVQNSSSTPEWAAALAEVRPQRPVQPELVNMLACGK